MLKKKQFVKKLEEYDKVDDLFLVLAKQIGVGRNKQSYLRLTVGDASGSIETRLWEGAEEYSRLFKQGDLVYLQGKVTTFKNVKQINTDRISPIDDLSKIDWADFFPVAARPADEMWSELYAILGEVANPDLKRLIEAFVADEAFIAKFKRSPAATGMHHAYIAGLLEHTLGVVKLAGVVSSLYPMNRDLLTIGAFLHDIGKTAELQAAAGFDYTDEGRLLGHLVIGLTMVREKCAALPNFPRELQTHVEHLMLSHHGELEWGSPKRPKTVEALALHAIDNIDAKITAASKAINDAEEAEESWTGYMRMFERPLTRTPDFGAVAEVSPAPVKAPPAPAVTLCEKVETAATPEAQPEIESLEIVEEEASEGQPSPENGKAEPAVMEENAAATEPADVDASREAEPLTLEPQKATARAAGQGKLGI